MSKKLLDVLVDPKKIEEIAALPTPKDVENKLKEEGINATPEDVKVLGNVFEAATKISEDQLDKLSGGGLSPRAIKALKIIGGVAAVGAAGYVGYKNRDTIKGWFSHSEPQIQTQIPPQLRMPTQAEIQQGLRELANAQQQLQAIAVQHPEAAGLVGAFQGLLGQLPIPHN